MGTKGAAASAVLDAIDEFATTHATMVLARVEGTSDEVLVALVERWAQEKEALTQQVLDLARV